MFTEFDVVVCVIILISTVVSLLRGFIHDFLSLIGWFGAALITLAFYPYAASLMEELFRSSIVVSVVSVIMVYILSLVVISLINNMILDNLRDFRRGFIDRFLGILFGCFKGVIIVSAIHFSIATVAENEPSWLKEGKTYKLTSQGNIIVKKIFGDYAEEEKETIKSKTSAFSEFLEENVDIDNFKEGTFKNDNFGEGLLKGDDEE